MNQTTHETYDLDVCVDCLMVLANGVGEEGTEQAAEGIAREWPTAELSLGSLECPDCITTGEVDNPCDEGWFSWSSCGGCGSRLGGQRFHATAWVKKGES